MVANWRPTVYPLAAHLWRSPSSGIYVKRRLLLYFMKTGHQKSINNKSSKSSSRRFPVKLFLGVTISTFLLVANTHAESLSIPDTSINYSDGVSDYFGVVDAGGVTINGTSFTPLETSPPFGSAPVLCLAIRRWPHLSGRYWPMLRLPLRCKTTV